ncbi:hypothetical protein [Pseudoduganella sp. HUAS MS19]
MQRLVQMTGTNKKRPTSTEEVDVILSKLPNLVKKKSGGYKYRKVVPKELQKLVGQTEIKKQLTGDPRAIRLQWSELEAYTTKLFEAKRLLLEQHLSEESALEAYLRNKPAPKRLPAATVGLANQLAVLHLQPLAEEAEARRLGHRWMSEAEMSAFNGELAEVTAQLKNAIAMGDVSAFIPTVTGLALWRGYVLIDESGEDMQALTYDFLRAVQEGCRVLAARQDGQFAEPNIPPGEPLQAVWQLNIPSTKAKQKKVHRLSDITPLYQERLSTAPRKTQTTKLSWWVALVDFCHNKALEDVSENDIYEFFNSRLYAEQKPWSMGYLPKVRAGLKDAFGIAKLKNLCSRNPAGELDLMPKIKAAEEQKRKKPRKAYEVEQLNGLLESDWFNPDATNWRGKMKWDLGARYWAPLISVYHGLRVRETMQLRVSDFGLKAGHLLMAIQVEDTDSDENDEDKDDEDKNNNALPTRRLKNEATRRQVPVHPKLIELGFLDFLELSRRHGLSAPLFPSALPERSSLAPLWGRSYEQSFLRWVRDSLGYGKGFGNHSFRHTLERCMRQAQLVEPWPPGLGQFYSGRTLPSDADKRLFLEVSSDRLYGDGFDPATILPWVQRIQYGGIKLPKPFAEWLDGRPAVDSHLVALLDTQWGRAWRDG